MKDDKNYTLPKEELDEINEKALEGSEQILNQMLEEDLAKDPVELVR